MRRKEHRPGTGFTIVELLVVIAIIGIIAGMSLPAIGAAREAARKTQCKNNLRQLSVAAQAHHESHSQLPTNGWGYLWVGDPSRGYRESQPGGWIFNILAFVEEGSTRRIPFGNPGPREVATARMLATPINVFNCPSRRQSDGYAYRYRAEPLRNSRFPVNAAKSDYAINGGDMKMLASRGPDSAAQNDIKTYAWPNTGKLNGIGFVRSRIRLADVKDGTSNTLLFGEKYIARGSYTSSAGDDQAMYVGDSDDIRRWTMKTPWPDSRGIDDVDRFGSRHSAGCHFAFCDGSTRFVSYQVESSVFSNLGNRQDFVAVDFSQLE